MIEPIYKITDGVNTLSLSYLTSSNEYIPEWTTHDLSEIDKYVVFGYCFNLQMMGAFYNWDREKHTIFEFEEDKIVVTVARADSGYANIYIELYKKNASVSYSHIQFANAFSGSNFDPRVMFIALDHDTQQAIIRIGGVVTNDIGTYVQYASVENSASSRTSNYATAFYNVLNGHTIPLSTDPYDPAGNTTPAGGDGNWGIVGDDIIPATIPTALSSGMINAYKITTAELGKFARYIWDNNFFENIVKNMYSVMDTIIGVNAYPFAVNSEQQSEYVVMGNVEMTGELNVTGKFIANNFHKISCGFIDVPTSSGNTYLDYAPFTKISVYLPFIGIQALNPDEILNKRLMIDYYIDIITGACMATLSVIKGNTTQCLNMFSGSCNSDIPVTGASYSNKLNNLIATLGSGLALAGGIAGGVTSVGAGMATVSNATSLATEKPNIHRSGTLSGSMGFCSPTNNDGLIVPYLIIEHPIVAHAENENTFRGYPSEITYTLSDLTGFTIIDEIHLENISATDTELNEIDTLLHSGVII